MRHLWEYDHPYYCGEATWYKVEDHHRWASWADFTDETIFLAASPSNSSPVGAEPGGS